FIDLSTGRDLACGLTVDGHVHCWYPGGADSYSPPPELRFGLGALDAGFMHTCQVRADGKLTCWGGGASANSPASFSEIGAGERFDCARDDYGLVQCWGNNDYQQLQVPVEPLHNLSLGRAHACAVKSVGGEAACWGWNSNDQTVAPPGTFKNLGAGLAHSCGVFAEGAAACWGYNGDGQSTVPELWNGVRWLAIQAGAFTSCGLSSDNFITCWGRLDDALPPTGYFRALSVGNNHSCAIRTDGRLACWGMNWSGQTNAPEGTYVAVTAGEMHSCAIRSDGARVCWGDGSSAPDLHLEPGTLPSVRLNDWFNTSFQLVSSSSYDPMDERFAISAGTLPEGFRLEENGWLSGPAMQAGRFPITVEGRDDNGFVATRDYVIVIDDTPPLIQPMVTGPLGDNGWYVGDVSVDWSVTDPESELAWTTGCEHQDIRFDVPQLAVHCMADSTGGHAEQMLELKRDATAPHTLLRNVVTEAGTARFEFEGDDAMSGIADFECSLDGAEFTACASPLVLNVTSGPHEFKVRAVDAAGNHDPWPAPYMWTADATPPVIDAFVRGDQRRGEGWYTSDVSIDWPVFDPESPVTSTVGCEPTTLASDALGASFTCTATSNGGTSSKTVTVKRDATAPVIIAAATTAPNATGWYNRGVEVAFSCSDATSGIEHCDDRMQWLDGEGTLSSNPQSALDVAGNDAVSNVVTVKIDHTPPALAPTVSATTLLLNGTATVAANGSDALSGIATQSCDPLATGSIGSKTVDCTAIDRAGNTAGGSAGYRVVYGFSGFNAPVQNPPVLNVFKAGRSIPLRWRVVDAQGAPVTNLSSATVSATAISCPNATENRISTYGGSNGQLQNLGNGYYQLDWLVSFSLRGYCSRLDLKLGDGELHSAQFKFN
ncbi:MAG TPA: PxKF domain-containing protein, partial [Lysobacter sp.]|nr:PxKF domain-containing protein [Lysobacter sp.]